MQSLFGHPPPLPPTRPYGPSRPPMVPFLGGNSPVGHPPAYHPPFGGGMPFGWHQPSPNITPDHVAHAVNSGAISPLAGLLIAHHFSQGG